MRTGQNPPEGYDEAASASERLALYKETPEYQAEQARLAEWQRIADEQAAQAAYQIYREGEWVSIREAESGGKSLAMPAQNDGPPPLVIINVLPDWLRIVTTAINDSIIQPIKERINKLSRLFHNAYGQDLVTISEADSPETALWKTYIIAAINVQRDGINFGGYGSGKGPAQLSQEQLDADYGEPYGCKKIPGETKTECRGYGLGLKGKSPYDPNVAVDGMTNRIEQVLNFAENQSEKNDVILDDTDRFIIIALSQNGPGFDKDDISNLLINHIVDGRISWKDYFRTEHDSWPEEKAEKPWLEQVWLEAWEVIKTGNGGKDFNTEFQLELYYQELLALESQGYPLPEGLDIQRIEALMNTSEQAKQED